MGEPERIEADLDSTPINIACNWSPGYVTTGTKSFGNLVLTSTTPGVDVVLTQGEQLVFLDLPVNWTIEPDSSDWVRSTFPFRGQNLPALTYQGTGLALHAFVRMVEHWVEPDKGGDADTLGTSAGTGAPIAVGITAPTTAPAMLQVALQLFDRSGAQVTTRSTVLLSAVSPESPFVAYSTAPAVVLLTQPEATVFPNVLGAVLQNLRNVNCATLSATLTITAQTSDGKDVPITAALDTVEVSGGAAQWAYDGSQHGWSAEIQNIRSLGQVAVTISNLALDDATIALVLATFTLESTTDPGHIYTITAWYQAYGPYSLQLSLSSAVSTAIFYRLTDTAESAYAVNTLNPLLRAPPLQPDLVDTTGTVVYPPIPGWYSWSKDKPFFPSSYNLMDGPNNLYFLVKATGGTMMPLTDGTVQYDFTPNDIYAAGFQQTFGPQNQPQFGPIMPAGAIILWNGSPANVPAGWALCDGTNNTPNLESRFVVGAGTTEIPGTSGDATAHVHNISINQTYDTTTSGVHSHLMPSGWYSRNLSCGVHTGLDTSGQNVATSRVQDDGAHTHSVTVSLSQDSAATIAPRPAWYALCYIMKL